MTNVVIKGKITQYYYECKSYWDHRMTKWWIWSNPAVTKQQQIGLYGMTTPFTTFRWVEHWTGDTISSDRKIGDFIDLEDGKSYRILEIHEALDGTVYYHIDYVIGEEDDEPSLKRANEQLAEVIETNAKRSSKLQEELDQGVPTPKPVQPLKWWQELLINMGVADRSDFK
jgi:hypothetical protein